MKKCFTTFAATLAAVSLFIVGCSDIESESEKISSSDTTPYANLSDLNKFAESGFVNYKVARYYALETLENFQDESKFQNGTLSELPLVIYNAKTGEPRYYEFKVLQNGTPVAAITCVANRDEGLPVKYVLPYSDSADESSQRAVSTGSAKFVDSGYPSKLCAKTDSERAAESDAEVELNVLEALEALSSEELEGLGLGDKSEQEKLKAEIEADREEKAEIWKSIDEATEDILSLSEEELEDKYFSDDEEDSSRKVLYTDHEMTSRWYLNDWYDTKDWNYSGGYCGPNCLAFIIAGLGEKSGYNGVPKPYWGSDSINRYYSDIENYVGTGAKSFPTLSNKLRSLTKGRYKLSSSTPSYLSMTSHMASENLPGISLRCSKSVKDIAFHYRTIVGCRRERAKLILKVFRKKKTINSWYDDFYYMHDNGADGRDFMENADKWYVIGVRKVIKN